MHSYLLFFSLLQSLQAELDVRSQDVIRKESQVMIALQERDSSIQKLKDQEGIGTAKRFSC